MTSLKILLLCAIIVAFSYAMWIAFQSIFEDAGKTHIEKARPESMIAENQSMAIAGIHATILSIIIGALSAYALFLYGKSDEVGSAILNESNKIARLSAPRYARVPDLYKADTPEKREAMLRRLRRVMNKAAVTTESGETKVLEDWERGKALVDTLMALESHYPFTDTPEGTNIQPWNDWLKEASSIDFIISTRVLESPEVEKIINAYTEKMRDEYLPSRDPAVQQTINPNTSTSAEAQAQLDKLDAEMDLNLNPRVRFEALINNYKEFKKIAGAIETKVAEYNAHLARQKGNRNFLLTGLILAGIAFFCGVLLPLIVKEPPSLFIKVVPIIFYVVAFIYVVNKTAQT